MNIRLSNISDVPAIMDIIGDAQRYLASLNIDQWQDGYPTEEQIRLDIANSDSYVVTSDADETMGTTVFSTKIEPTYNQIDGDWLTPQDARYGVIHRLAVSDRFRSAGLAKFVFNFCEQELFKTNIMSMRIDTHRDNKGMQALLTKLGYQYCGVIIITSGAERLAYEKILA